MMRLQVYTAVENPCCDLCCGFIGGPYSTSRKQGWYATADMHLVKTYSIYCHFFLNVYQPADDFVIYLLS